MNLLFLLILLVGLLDVAFVTVEIVGFLRRCHHAHLNPGTPRSFRG